MGTWEFHRIGSVWNEKRQCCCPNDSPTEQLSYLILFLQKRDFYYVFPILPKYSSLLFSLLTHMPSPHSHCLDSLFEPLILQSSFFLLYYTAIFPKARAQPISIHQISWFIPLCEQKLIREKPQQSSHLM